VTRELLVAGGGIAGLAAALAARAAGWEARVVEQAPAFSEVGAGVQLGPNATRLLRQWDLLGHPLLRAVEPSRLRVRDAVDGRELGSLRLGPVAQARYGAPYLTLHRADLQAALLARAADAGVRLHAGTRLARADVQGATVQATTSQGQVLEAEALAVADGVWSTLRDQLLGREAAPWTGHVAYRALVEPSLLPGQGDEVHAWLGPRMHVVSYPVRAGQAVNVVAFTEGRSSGQDWDQPADASGLQAVRQGLCPALQAILDAVPAWRLWPVHDRAPLASASGMASGRAALLGDAAHPMRPYLAQGAGMALEDAAGLQRVLAACDGRVIDVPTALQRYALDRWERCARVQRRAMRNGVMFHAQGPLRVARNVALRVGGEKLLDLPWLYGGP
jgi:salicylate hydroxylase